MIAQEVEAIFSEMVFTDSEGYKSVDYSRLTPVLIEAVKELSEMNDVLEEKVIVLEKSMADQQIQNDQITDLQYELDNLKALVTRMVKEK